MKHAVRLYIIIGLVAILLSLIQLTRVGVLLNTGKNARIEVEAFDPDQAGRLSPDEINLYQRNSGLMIYPEESETLLNVQSVLSTLQFDYDMMPASGHLADYQVYDLVVLLEVRQDDLADREAIMQYVRTGGKMLYIGNGGKGINDLLCADAPFFGIRQTGPQRETNAAYFITELLTGITGPVEITGEFMTPYTYFQTMDVNLDQECQIHMESGDGNPMIWEWGQMNGKVMVMNVGRTGSKETRGLIAGSIAALMDVLIYPVIGSEVIFLDDFPADYHATSEILRLNYGRDLQRYILEIWWPQMMGLMRKYGLKYTGAFIESYSAQVDGQFEDNKAIFKSTESLAGDVLASGGEICLHGYNHQPLFYDQSRMDRYGYSAWPGSSQLVAALEKSVRFFQTIYPDYRFITYVPPSNLLDQAAISALRHAVPSLRVISGVYFGETDASGADNPDDFDQDFGLDDQYGVALPRVSSGGFLTDEVRFMIASVLTTNGIVSHFIHPDDVLDPVRCKGLKWEELYDQYDALLGFFNEQYGWLSKDTAAAAAAKLEQVACAEIYYSRTAQKLEIICDHFGSSLTLLVTSGQQLRAGSNCLVQQIDSMRYLVIMQAEKVTLEVDES